MNVKSRFESEEEVPERRSQYMRGMCSTPLGMIEETAHLNMSKVKVPKFIQKFFRFMGWKTQADKRPDNL